MTGHEGSVWFATPGIRTPSSLFFAPVPAVEDQDAESRVNAVKALAQVSRELYGDLPADPVAAAQDRAAAREVLIDKASLDPAPIAMDPVPRPLQVPLGLSAL